MSPVEPVPEAPTAIATLDGERALVIADYHAGIETELRYEGIEVDSRADERREELLALIDEMDVDRVIILGDLAHWIGEPIGAELDEIQALVEAITDRVPALLVKGNHDGEIEDAIDIPVTDSSGVRIGDVGFVHGHTWPSEEVLQSEVVCVGHEHPAVSLEDEVGGRRVERVWLRGQLVPEAFDEVNGIDGELVVFPAFNELVGRTWVNVEGQGFLAPYLPEALGDAQTYLLDGTRLGPYATV